MSTHGLSRRHNRDLPQPHVVGAILLIALGLVFLAQQAGWLERSGNWWVIFLLIPGLGLLWSSVAEHQREHQTTGRQIVEAIFGIIMIALTVIFIFDPNWTFLGASFRSSVWDQIWRWGLLVLGAVLFIVGIRSSARGIAVFGAILAIVGAVFIFDINWDYVWPLALIVPGLWLLYNAWRQPAKE